MPPSNLENKGEMFSHASEVLVYDLLSLSDYHAEWPNLVVSDRFKKDSVKLLKKMQDQVLVSSALVQQITKLDYERDVERILTPLKSLESLLKNIDDHLLSGRVPFHISDEIEKNFDDLAYHLSRYLSLLDDLASAHGHPRHVQ